MAAPILLCDTAGMDEKRWLECRKHGPKGDIEYTIGGSDVASVFGVSPWTTPLELWRQKKGLSTPPDFDNEDQKEMGHLLEPIVAHWYQKKSDNYVVSDTGLYQHADYVYALANIDYGLQAPDGTDGVLECKSTTYHKADDWADDAIPFYYELQVRFYLAVMDREFAYIACLWGNNPKTDLAIRRIDRDKATEALIFERLDYFIDSLYKNIPPTMADVDPALAMGALAKIYGKNTLSSPTIEFGKKDDRKLRKIAALQDENRKFADYIKNNEREVNALSVQIADAMKEHEHGILETTKDKLIIDYVPRSTNRVNSEKLKKDHPTVYEEVLKESISRKVKVTVEPIAV